MKTKRILIAVICILALAVVVLSSIFIMSKHKPDVGSAVTYSSITSLANESTILSTMKSQNISDINANQFAIEQMSEKELDFYKSLLSNINLFNVPMSVRVVRINTIEDANREYLALLKSDNRLGVTLSGQYKIAPNGIEEMSESIHYNDPEFNIDLINQAIEEYWELDIYPEYMELNENAEIWVTDYYLDEFQKPTSNIYITNEKIVWGKFSNSATTNEKLAVKMVIDEKNIAIALYQYGSEMVKNYSTYSAVSYKIVMSMSDGTKQDITGTMYCGGDRVCIDDKYKPIIIAALCGNETIDFYLQDNEIVISTYLFSIEPNNFADLYASTFLA